MRRQAAADVKREFSRVLRAAELGEQTVVLRHGRPVAVVGPFAERPASVLPTPRRPGGLLSLVGLFEDWETMDRDLAEIIADRQGVPDRAAPDLT